MDWNPQYRYYSGADLATTSQVIDWISNNAVGTGTADQFRWVEWHYNSQEDTYTFESAINQYQQYRTYWPNQWQTSNASWYSYSVTDPMQVWDNRPITQEEADRRLAATRAQMHKNAVRRQRAIKKGRKLLLEVLSSEQMTEYAKSRSFTVCGADGKTYKVRKGATTHEMKNGVAVKSHCIHLPHSYIDEDTMVAVKLLLETNPKMFHEIANTSALVGSPPTIRHGGNGGVDQIAAGFSRLSEAARTATEGLEVLAEAIRLAEASTEVPHLSIAA